MPIKTTELTEQLKHHLEAARAIAKSAEDGDRDFTDEERAQVTEHMAKAKEARDGLERAKADSDMRSALKELGDGISFEEKQERRTPSGLIVPDAKASLGETFVKSGEYQTLMSSAPNGVFGKDHRVQSRPVGYKALVTGGSDTSGGAFVTNDMMGLQVNQLVFQRPLKLRDVVTNLDAGISAIRDAIEF
jgi:hypothetical protein